MCSEKRKSQGKFPWMNVLMPLLIPLVFAVLSTLTVIVYCVHVILAPLYIIDIFVNCRERVEALPDTSLWKKIVRGFYAVYGITIK
jgi:hypothetical protein